LKGEWTPHDTRDAVVDFVNIWPDKTAIPATRFIRWLVLAQSKFYDWRQRYGRANEHNGLIPRDFWLEPWERKAIIDYHIANPLEGYRRLTFMMLDADVVAISPTTTWRVLHNAGLLNRWKGKPSKKGTGFIQPLSPHEHWHVDVSHINIAGTYYHLCSLLDGYSRYIVHWDIGETMTEGDIEIIVQAAREKFPGETPRIISDNGPQFISRDFKGYLRICGMTHVRTSLYYPQSNGKIEAWHKIFKGECIRPKTPLSLDDARRIATSYIAHYNNTRLHGAIGYIAPKDKLEGREKEIFAARDRKLEAARAARKTARDSARNTPAATID
jgi:transposase InsO family protein